MTRPKSRNEYKEFVAQSFLSCLEEKGTEWKEGWLDAGAPKNGISNRPYKGMNALYLSIAGAARGSTDPRWFTLNQIKDSSKKYHPGSKWTINKGARAEYVEYVMPYDISAGAPIGWDEYKEQLAMGRGEDEFGMVSRYTPVFNASEIKGVEPEKNRGKKISPDRIIRVLSENMSVPVCLDGGSEAYYSVSTDTIHMPLPELFHSGEEFDMAALHEFSHATGHPSRLGRDFGGGFGSEKYAYEELVAEISSCLFWPGTGCETPALENHKSYVRAWAGIIKNDKEALFRAVKDAGKAADYLERAAGFERETEKEKMPPESAKELR